MNARPNLRLVVGSTDLALDAALLERISRDEGRYYQAPNSPNVYAAAPAAAYGPTFGAYLREKLLGPGCLALAVSVAIVALILVAA